MTETVSKPAHLASLDTVRRFEMFWYAARDPCLVFQFEQDYDYTPYSLKKKPGVFRFLFLFLL